MKKQNQDYHREPLTGIRFPGELKAEAKEQAAKHGMSFNELVVRAVKKILSELKKKDPVI